jgi:cobalamin-dependent methionine synthase I
VHTVPSDFLEQDIKTETQAERIRREEEAARANEAAKRKAASKAKRADSWITRSVTAIAIANVAGIVGVSGFLGYRAWGLYEKSRLDLKHVGVGVGVLAAVGAVEALLGRYLYRGRKE